MRAWHRVVAGLVGELANPFGHAEKAGCRTGLPARQLPAAGVVRKAAVMRQRVAAHEGRAFALGAEAEVLELHHHDDGVVVIGLDEVDVGRRDTRLRVQLVTVGPPAATHHHRVLRIGVVALDAGVHQHMRQAEVTRPVLAHHEEGLGAGARHHAIEQVDRVRDRLGRHVLGKRQRLLEQGVRVLQGVVALRDRDAAEVVTRGAIGAHVVRGDEREDRVRPARAIRIGGVAREVAERAQSLAE